MLQARGYRIIEAFEPVTLLRARHTLGMPCSQHDAFGIEQATDLGAIDDGLFVPAPNEFALDCTNVLELGHLVEYGGHVIASYLVPINVPVLHRCRSHATKMNGNLEFETGFI